MRQQGRIKEIFEIAHRLTPCERARILDDMCGDDVVLRREVESLLESHDDAGSLLETPAFVDPTAPASGLSAGDTLSHYKILNKIGEGGMGEVFLGLDTSLKRKVALKLLPPGLSEDDERLRRFEQEALAASSLNHPNIVTIHEFSRTDDGKAYIASEFVQGECLTDRIASGEMTLEEKLGIAKQIASALAAAHEAGVIHRDIKPDNIIVRPDGLVKVLDFGIAKFLGTALIHGSEAETIPMVKTQTGMVIGSAPYMSPEQAKGLEVDHRTDLWSLGVILYEMIAGERPFKGETISHTIVAILEKEPMPIRDVPEDLQQILRKMLEKDRENRFRSARELLTDLKKLRRELQFRGELERSLDPNRSMPASSSESAGHSTDPEKRKSTGEGTLVTATSGSGPKFLTGRRGKYKAIAIVAGMALAVAVAAAGYIAFFGADEKEIASIAVLPFRNESGNKEIEYLTDGMAETLINSLSSIPNLDVRSRSAVFRYKGADVEPRKIAEDLRVESVLTGRISQGGEQLTLVLELIDARTGDVLWNSRYEGNSSELAALQSQITRDVSNRLRAELSGADKRKVMREYTADPEAYRLYLQGLFYWNKRGGEDFKKAVEFYQQALEKDPEFALAYAGMAMSYVLYTEFGVAASPRESLPMVKAAAMKAIELDPSLAEPHTALGLYHRFYTWDLDAADRELRKAIELDPHYATAHQWLSLNLAFQGRFDESIEAMERAGQIDPLSRIIRRERGYVLFLARRYDEAIEHIKDNQALMGEVNAGWSLGRIYLAKGMYKEAIEEIWKSTRIGSGPSGMLVCALVRSGQRKEALKVLQELESKWEERPEWHTQGDRAAVYTALGDKDKAFYWLNRMLITRSNVTRVMSGPELDDLRDDPRFEDLKRQIAEAKIR